MTNKRKNHQAWFLVLPAFLLVAITAIIPMMAVVNYAFQDFFSPTQYFWVGTEWFEEILADPVIHRAFGRQILFTLIVLAIEVPLGVFIALRLPKGGLAQTVSIIILALPLLIPWNVVGNIWNLFGRTDVGLFGYTLNAVFGINFSFGTEPLHAWIIIVLMDVWHWTPLIVLLTFAGLNAIPSAYYQAAEIDGARGWAVFRYIQLPRLKGVLTIGILLRMMDSLIVYTEPFIVTGGGPGESTTFLSTYLVQRAIGRFDIGPSAAFSIIYFLIILLLSWIFYTILNNAGEESRK